MSHFKNLTGQQFGRWTATKPTKTGRGTFWTCICACGSERAVAAKDLLQGKSKSCGCYRKDIARSTHTTHGLFRTGTYKSWNAMMRRCLDSSYVHKHYRDLGITICEGWQRIDRFYSDMGDRPLDHEIDRRDNAGHYTCGKCAQCVKNGWPMNGRWADKTTQANNRSTNVVLTYNGKAQTIIQWARELGIPPPTLYDRLRHHWSIERALTK